MNDPLVLRWGTAHSLTISRSLLVSGLMATLAIIKKDMQSITVELPPDITLETIEQAWADQGGTWDELEVENTGKKFSALRVIWLPDGHCLQWFVLHIQDRPFDAFVCTKLTKELWSTTF